jgi:hypothetical protein
MTLKPGQSPGFLMIGSMRWCGLGRSREVFAFGLGMTLSQLEIRHLSVAIRRQFSQPLPAKLCDSSNGGNHVRTSKHRLLESVWRCC